MNSPQFQLGLAVALMVVVVWAIQNVHAMLIRA